MSLIVKSWKFDFLYFSIFCCLVIFFYVKYSFDYWKRKKISFVKPSFPFGNLSKNVYLETSTSELMIEFCRKMSEPFFGIFAFLHPILVISDANLMRCILIKDFASFPNRGIYCDEAHPLSEHLFAIEDEKWRNLRNRLSPAFTCSQIRSMFETIVDCGRKLDRHVNHLAVKSETFKVHELLGSHATNFIAAVAFGIELDCIQNPNDAFRVHGRKIFEPTLKNSLRDLLSFMNPKLMKLLNRFHFLDQSIENIFANVVKNNLEYRDKNNIERKDFFQLLICLKKGINICSDGVESDKNQQITLNEMIAQVFLFFIAGSETVSCTLAWAVYEIVRNSEIQFGVQKEIDEVLRRHDGQYTYESIKELKYLDMCIDGKLHLHKLNQLVNLLLLFSFQTETLRLYPPVPILNRKASQAYRITGTDVVIDAGTDCFLPIVAAQRDARYYPQPDEFDPNRFSDASRADPNFASKPYFPFGDGPRYCLGMRLARIMTKVSLAMMFEKYSYQLGENMNNRKVLFAPESFFMLPAGDIELKVQARKFRR